ncbi:MAG: hypothetical protein ACWA5X_12490, partial [bacterium]
MNKLLTSAVLATLLPASAYANLITNGDFEAGNTNFTSDYTYNPTTIFDAGSYSVPTDPHNVHGAATSYGDHTTGSGNMLAANGSLTAHAKVWGQSVAVTPNTDYLFSIFSARWYPSVTPRLSLEANSNVIGTYSIPLPTGQWSETSYTINSGANNTLDLRLYSLETSV